MKISSWGSICGYEIVPPDYFTIPEKLKDKLFASTLNEGILIKYGDSNMTLDIEHFFGDNVLEISNSNCDEERGDTDGYIELYYAQLQWYGDSHNPLQVDKKPDMVVKYGKCQKCGFGDVGVAKSMFVYVYDIMNVKTIMKTKIDWNDEEYGELPPCS